MSTEDRKIQRPGAEVVGIPENETGPVEVGEPDGEAPGEAMLVFVKERSDELAGEINRDILSVTAGEVVDQDAVAELDTLRREVEMIKRSFSERIREWLAEKRKGRQDKKDAERERQLQIPDNPKIIKDLLRRFQALEDIAYKTLSVEEKKQRKSKEKSIESEEQDVLMGRAILGREQEFFALAGEYHCASKEDGTKWKAVEGKVNLLASYATKSAMADKDFGKAVSFLGLMQPDSSYELTYVFFNTFLSSKGIPEGKISEPARSASELRGRFRKLGEVDGEMRQLLAGNPTLLGRFEEQSNYRLWERRMVFDGENFLGPYSEEVINNFYKLKESSRHLVLQEVAEGKKEMWDRVLGLGDRLVPCVELMVGLRDRFGKYPAFSERDSMFLERILSVEPSACDMALAKAESSLKKILDFGWPEVYGYVLVASVPDMTVEDIEKIPQERVKILSVLPIAFGEEDIQKILTKQELETWTEQKDFPNGWRKPWSYSGAATTFDPFTSERLVSFVSGCSESALAYMRAMRVRGKWRDGRETDERGIFEYVVALGNEEEVIAAIPEEWRDTFLNSLRPSVSRSSHDGGYKISNLFRSGVASNYLEYIELVGDESKMELDDLLHSSDLFEGNNYAEVEKGIQILKQELPGCLAHVDIRNQKVREGIKRAAVESRDTNLARETLKYFSEGRSYFVQQKREEYSREVTYERVERGPDMLDMYIFVELAEKYFRQDSDLMIEMFRNTYQLDEIEAETIKAYLGGKFAQGQPHHYDTPMLEGCFYSIIERCGIRYGYGSGLESLVSFLEERSKLTREEKELYVRFSNRFGACDIAMIHEGSAAGVLDIAEKFSGLNFPIEIYKKMLERPECIGLYYYLPAFEASSSSYGKSYTTQEVIDKLTELYDAGLDSSYYAVQCIAPKQGTSLSSYAVGDILSSEPQAVVYIANLVKEYNPSINLIDALTMVSTGKKLTLTEAEEARGRFVKQARIGAFTGTRDYLYPYDSQEIEHYDLDGATKNVQRAEAILGRPLTPEERKRFTKDFVYNVDAPLLEKVLSDPKILELFLKYVKDRYKLSAIESVDSVYLRDEIFWRFLPPQSAMEDSSLLETHMQLARMFVDLDLHVDTSGSHWWPALYRVFQKNPAVFNRDFLSVLRGASINAYEIVYITEQIPPDIEKTELDKIKRFLSVVSYDSGEFRSVIERARGGTQESKLQILESIHERLGFGLPIEFLGYVDTLISQGMNEEEIIRHIDELLVSEEATYEKDFEARSGVKGYRLFERWWTARNKAGLEALGSSMPETSKKILYPLMVIRGFSSKNNLLREYHSVIPEFTSLAPESRANIELLVSRYDKTPNTYIRNYVENLVTIAQSPHFAEIFSIITSGRIAELLESEPWQVSHFCDNFSANIVERINSLPPYVTYKLVDASDYFADPSFPQMLEFVEKMREICGEKFAVSVYQLLLMDFTVNLENLKKIEKNCSQRPLTQEVLERLQYVTDDESLRDSVDKVLFTFDKFHKLPLDRILPAVAKLSPEFRWLAVFNNIHNFGWKIFTDHMEYLINEMNFSEAQIRKLVVTLYKHYNSGPRVVNFQIFSYIWEAGKEGILGFWGDKRERVKELLGGYIGDPLELLNYIISDDNLFDQVAYSFFPDSFKKHNLFWQMWADKDPAIILLNFNEMPKGILPPESWRKVVKTLTEKKPDLLWAQKDGIPFVGDEFTRLLDTCIERGDSLTLRSVLLELLNGRVSISAEQKTKFIDSCIERGKPFVIDTLLLECAHGRLELSEEKKDKAVVQYIKKGGSLRLLKIDRPEEDLSQEEKECAPMFRSCIERLARADTSDPMQAVKLLLTLARGTALSAEYMSPILELLDSLPKEENELAKKAEELKAEMILQFDPTVRSSFNDPNKLGIIKSLVVSHLVEYIRTLQEAHTSQEEMIKILRIELLKIKRIYDSSDSTESNRRLIFRELYPFEQCQDLDSALTGVPAEEKKRIAEKIVVEDLHEVLILSGCKREIRSKDDRVKAEQAIQMADARNRALAERTKSEGRENLFLPQGALTHGLPAKVLEIALEVGNLSGELLGSSGKVDGSGLLGVDTCRVLVSDEVNFADKYRVLNNLGYGSVHLVYGDYHNERRRPYHSGAVGSDHELVRVGIPSTEITGIIIKYDTLLGQVKEDIAGKGFYIPILDTQGKLLFEPAEFDKMKVFYHTLTQSGYPKEVAKNVYEYYKTLEGKSDTKHAVVLNKAVEAVASGELQEDLVILVDFLRTNDLNSRNLEWYEKSSLADILKVIKKSVGVKSRARARTLLFGSQSNQRRRLGESVSRQIEEPIVRQNHSFIDAFQKKQIPFIGEETDEYDKALVDLLFKRNSFERLQEVSTLFTEQKKKLMRTLWNSVWGDLEKDPAWADKSEELKRYKEIIIPTIAGSGGRGEIVLGSDLDYNLIVDDRNIPEQGDTRVQLLSRLSSFVNTVLAERINAVLEHNDIRADAGLAKEDRQPFMLMSTIESFTIDVNKRRQTEEPTEIVDSEPLFEEQRHVVQNAREALLAKNQTSYLLESFVLRDLEMGLGKKSFIESFEELYSSAVSGKILDKIKESLQRTVTFKIYHLMFRAFETSGVGGIDKSESRNIPSTTTGKVDFLVRHNVLSKEEAKTCKELLLMAYKLRFLGELYSDEAQEKGLKKVKNVIFRLDEFSYEEREELFAMLKKFRETVLYK